MVAKNSRQSGQDAEDQILDRVYLIASRAFKQFPNTHVTIGLHANHSGDLRQCIIFSFDVCPDRKVIIYFAYGWMVELANAGQVTRHTTCDYGIAAITAAMNLNIRWVLEQEHMRLQREEQQAIEEKHGV